MRIDYFPPFIIAASAAMALCFSVSCSKDDAIASLETLGVSDITAHTATLSGRVGKTGDGITVGAEYSLNEEFPEGLTKSAIYEGNPGAISVPLRMLAPGRTYYYRFFSESGQGRHYGDTQSFCTLESPLPEGAVDMGLSVYWAEKNLGEKDDETGYYPGDLFAWGEIDLKQDYSWETYKWVNAEKDEFSLLKYNLWEEYGPVDGFKTLLPEDDAAAVRLGNGWRMPTKEEIEELFDSFYVKCTLVVEEERERGYCFQSVITGNTLFLPSVYQIGEQVFTHNLVYWTSSLSEEKNWSSKYDEQYSGSFAGRIWPDEEKPVKQMLTITRCEGLPIRPVHE